MKHAFRFLLPLLLLLTLALAVSASDNVVYLAGGSHGTGATPYDPVGMLTDAYNALDLSRDDATVVLCGAFTQGNYDFIYAEEYAGKVTFTSVYDGVDYRDLGASFASAGHRFVCTGAVAFRDITFDFTGDYYFVVANFHPVTVDTGVTVIAESPNLTGAAVNKGFSILGGYQNGQATVKDGAKPDLANDKPVSITVRSGSHIAIGAFSRAIDGVDYTGHAEITVEGDADVGVLYYEPINGASAGHSDVTVNVGGNAKIAKITCGDKPNAMARFTLNWASGTIGEFVRSDAAKASPFALCYGDGAYSTIEFSLFRPAFDSVAKIGEAPTKPASVFKPVRTYGGEFADVKDGDWFALYVKTAYEYKLASGTSAVAFSPSGKFTVAQALTAAANIHVAYTGKSVRAAISGEAWYMPYVLYCVENGIIDGYQFDDYNRSITRGEMATVFASILPAKEYAPVRDGGCPDVTPDMACHAGVNTLYAAGIVGGDAGTGNFRPNEPISRAEACVIFTRIAVPEYRAQ